MRRFAAASAPRLLCPEVPPLGQRNQGQAREDREGPRDPLSSRLWSEIVIRLPGSNAHLEARPETPVEARPGL